MSAIFGEGYLKGYFRVQHLLKAVHFKFPLIRGTIIYRPKEEKFLPFPNHRPWLAKLLEVYRNIGAIYVFLFGIVFAFKKIVLYKQKGYLSDLLSFGLYGLLFGLTTGALTCILTQKYVGEDDGFTKSALIQLWRSRLRKNPSVTAKKAEKIGLLFNKATSVDEMAVYFITIVVFNGCFLVAAFTYFWSDDPVGILLQTLPLIRDFGFIQRKLISIPLTLVGFLLNGFFVLFTSLDHLLSLFLMRMILYCLLSKAKTRWTIPVKNFNIFSFENFRSRYLRCISSWSWKITNRISFSLG